MLPFFQNFVKKITMILSQRKIGIKEWLVLANVLVVFFLILLSNIGILPFKKIEDFGFFTVILLMLALYRPGWMFLIFVGTIPLENINLASANLAITIRPYQFFGVLIIMAIIVRLLLRRSNFVLAKLKWPDYLVILITLSGFLSLMGAQNKLLSLKLAIIFTSFVMLYFLTRNYVQNIQDIKKILPFFLSSAIMVVLYGIWQNIIFLRGLVSFETMPGRPNATFTEADWLGIFLVLILAMVYALIFYFYKERMREKLKAGEEIKNYANSSSFQIPLLFPFFQRGRRKKKLLVTGCWLLVALIYILLILTVSRSAWLSALIITIIFIGVFLSDLRKSNWKWKATFYLKLKILASLILSVAIIYVFHLTNFQLFNRVQSTGSGLQEITVACKNEQGAHQLRQLQYLKQVEQLEHFGCRHINLEDIKNEKVAGNIVMTVYRPDPNVAIRGQIYQRSWQEIKNHSILGIGWGSMRAIFGQNKYGHSFNSSNIFLQTWLGSGIVGLLSLLILLFYLLYKAIKSYYFAEELPVKSWNLFIILSWFGIVTANLFNAGIFLGFFWIWLGMINVNN